MIAEISLPAVAAHRARLELALEDGVLVHLHLVRTRSGEYPSWTVAYHKHKRLCGTGRCLVVSP